MTIRKMAPKMLQDLTAKKKRYDEEALKRKKKQEETRAKMKRNREKKAAAEAEKVAKARSIAGETACREVRSCMVSKSPVPVQCVHLRSETDRILECKGQIPDVYFPGGFGISCTETANASASKISCEGWVSLVTGPFRRTKAPK